MDTTETVDQAYYIATETEGTWHISDDMMLRPRCGEEINTNLRVKVIWPEAFRSRYKVCRECDPQDRTVNEEVAAETQADPLIQTRFDAIGVEGS